MNRIGGHKLDVKITDQARDQIQDMMKEESSDVRLRFGVQGGGCSGLSYALGFDDEVNAELDEVNTVNDIQVVMSKMYIPMIEYTEIDYKLKIIGSSISINNINDCISTGLGTCFS